MSALYVGQSARPVTMDLRGIPGSPLGGVLRFPEMSDAADIVSALETTPHTLPDSLNSSEGLLLLPNMHGITAQPELLVRLSRLCGTEVENYYNTLTPENMIHPEVAEILVLGNKPPCDRPPPPAPQPPLTEDGKLPVQFPHRRGWHSDQSFRRPPPDISLFYAVIPCLKGQGQTLFANGIAAYEALPGDLREKADKLDGLHALLGTGRSEKAVLAGDPVKPLQPHQRSQRQPLVRVHPVTGKRALYMCEGGQMDWLDGPVADMEPGPNGEGARLLYALMSHYTQPCFTYVHDWDAGDLIIYDNRCLIHAATWYDVEAHDRLMWRTTIVGNPGEEYAGESKSWIPAAGAKPMAGLEEVQWDKQFVKRVY